MILFIISFYLSDTLFHIILGPLIKALPYQQGMIATQITTPVLLPLNVAADVSLLLTMPFLFLQIWFFIAPALYQHERQKITVVLFLSFLLFILGLLFCFYIVLPFMFQFFIHALPSDIHMLPDIYHSLDFILRMLLIFGLCFQVPLICLLFLHIQWITIEQLKMIRPYIIVTAFILGMLLTPPDVFSQILLAIPLCLLYELGILLCYWQSIKLRTISEH